MEFVKKGVSVVWLAVVIAMAMIVVFSSPTAADYCEVIGPCNSESCRAFCVQKQYSGKFQAFCLPSFTNGDYQSCCCRVPG